MENRSVRRTRNMLKEEFLRLLEEKPIQEITVKELTDNTELNRGTFYFHYKDVYDLLEKLEEGLLADFNQIVGNMGVSAVESLIPIYSLLYENQKFCRILLGPNGDIAFVNRLKTVFAECFRKVVIKHNEHHDFEGQTYFDAFIINGFIGIAEIWLNDPYKKSPEDMAIFTSDFFMASFQAYLG